MNARPLSSISRRARLLVAALATVLAFLPAASASAALQRDQTLLTLDPAIPIGLDIAKVQLRAIGSAKSGSAGIYLPVSRSRVDSGFHGYVRHQGGLEFVVAKQLRLGLRYPTIKIGRDGEGTLSAMPVIQGIAINFPVLIGKLTTASVSSRSGNLDATFRLRVDKQYADLVNGALGTKLLPAGLPWATIQTRVAAADATDATAK